MTVSDPFQAPSIPAREELDDVSESAAPEAEHVDLSPDASAPLGYVIDRATGERRPKKKAGRPPKTTVQRRTESAKADPPPAKTEADLVPGQIIKPTGSRRRQRGGPAPDPEPVAPFRAGPIAKGVNRLYRKAGKILSVWDREIGAAVIECTRKDIDPETGEPDPDDVTVGEAWEEIARVNPRIRRILLRMIEGGAWGQLLMAHAPILLAILMKESILKRLPMGRLLAAFMDDSESGDDIGGPQGPPAGLFAGLTPEDLNQAMSMFGQMMPPDVSGYTRTGTGTVPADLFTPAPVMNHRVPTVDDFARPADED